MTGSVAVIGSGMMGSAIAAMSALAGNRTLMVDLNMEKCLKMAEKMHWSVLKCGQITA